MASEVRDVFKMTTKEFCRDCKKTEIYYYANDPEESQPRCLNCLSFNIGILCESPNYKNGLEQQEYSEQKKREEENMSEKPVFDVVQKPYHYNVGIEVYAYIKSWKMGYEAGNIIKYVTRYPYKDSKKRVQDLEKAKWYLERLIELEKEKEEERNNESK